LPFKSVVMGTYESFFQTSRAQDRIVVYFSGHAQFRDGAAYLAPMEADPDDLSSFIPLADFYDKMEHCRATQKVVIWDVCRYNPERGIIRPGSEPMSKELFAALQAAPSGVEVIITCQPGENALEFNSVTLPGGGRTMTYAGSAFLIAARIAAERRKGVIMPPQPDDPLPVAEWVAEVQQRLQEVLEHVHLDKKQTIQVQGARPVQLIASNPQEPPARQVVIPPPPKTASPADVALIYSEFQLPPLKDDFGQDNMASFPFDPQLLELYRDPTPLQEVRANKERYRFRATVLQAFDEIRDIWRGNPASGGTGQLPEVIKAPITDELKKEIFAGLDFYALGIARLELMDTTLDSLESLRQGEPKRWQAHYDYARAAVKTRLAYLNEYNKVMGLVRTNTLPELDPKLGQNQYKLASSNRMRSGKEVEPVSSRNTAALRGQSRRNGKRISPWVWSGNPPVTRKPTSERLTTTDLLATCRLGSPLKSPLCANRLWYFRNVAQTETGAGVVFNKGRQCGLSSPKHMFVPPATVFPFTLTEV
jgi:hypothetical protein